MRRLAALLVLALPLLAGCVSVSVGSADVPGLTYYVLADARQAPPVAPAADATARIALQAAGADPIADSIAIAYSRRPSERAFYQFASWTERPSVRLTQLARQRLASRGRFASVTQLGQPVDSDWLMSISLESLVHDVSTKPGRARLALRAELMHRAERKLVAQRTFTAAPPVAEEAAPAAVAAFAGATADVLDALSDWVEATVASRPPR